jgi:diguanylate cyclase (GGDEF)-like protein
LVSRLTKKLTELEDLNIHLTGLNNELFESREQLAKYNDRLFYLNNLANQLRTESDPARLIKILPARITEGFHIKRCILFELDRENRKLYPFSSIGEAQSALTKLKLQFSDSFLKKLKDEGGILWIKNINEILDKTLLKLAKKLKSNTFILGNLSQLGTQSDATSVLQKFAQAESSELENAPPRRFMFFLDKGESNSVFETYEIRILKSFMQTVGIIYENILLYSRLVDLYRIREQQAIRDGLTRVYNFRYFMQELEREANRNRRFHTPFSLLMIDVDHFKQFNDNFGHMAGDTVLRGISELIDENTRTTDTVARYGGEEFAVILPGLNKKDSVQIAEKLRVLIDENDFTDVPEAKRKITISIGVASFPEDAESGKELLKLSDKALYAAKKSGRNKVSLA